MTHALRRTSPKGPGQSFIGYCIKCGTGELSPLAALEACPADGLVSDTASLLEMLDSFAREDDVA